MTGALRLLVAASAVAAVAALGAELTRPHRSAAAAPAPAPAVLPGPAPAAAPGAPPTGRESVPPGILSRAADARALDRAQCRGAPPEGADCAPHADPVEIDWDVRHEP